MGDKAPNTVFRNPIHFLAFGFGSGLSPVAPGTVGTLVAVPLYLLLDLLPLSYYLLALLLSTALGIYLCDKTARDIGVHDHGGIVWDEFVGYWITMLVAPAGWLWILLGFILFRFFDIIKPFPIGWLDKKIGGGMGIMIDDVVAGSFAWFCLQLIAMFVY
ncbi:phosphatidylglycerophosphatase A [Gammaproteobacteria bacterium]|nr:phosphatidylglycerophosphatase A [Gammaproteobacteria bacterium]